MLDPANPKSQSLSSQTAYYAIQTATARRLPRMGHDNQKSKSGYGVRHLFTGQQWYSELGLYDLRIADRHEDVGNPDLFSRSTVGATPAALVTGTTIYSTDGISIPGTGVITPSIPTGTVTVGPLSAGYVSEDDSGDDSSSGAKNPISAIGDVIGKILNIPNDVFGLILGVAGLPFGAEIQFGNNAIEFVNNRLVSGAITFGNVINYGPTSGPDVPTPGQGIYTYGDHEEQHTYQGQVTGPLYIPLNLIGGISSLIYGHGPPGDPWHGPANFMERGPLSQPPTPWGW